MHTVQFLKILVLHHDILAYTLIFFGIVFEGEFILVCTGVLAYLGALDIRFLLFFTLAAGLGKTFLGYYIGAVIRENWGETRFIKYISKKVLVVMPRFKEKPFWSIFLSKFILGVNHVVIIFAGFHKIALKTYIKAELITTAIWAPALLSLGFFFGYTALNVSREIWQFSLTALLLFIAFIVFDKLIARLYEIFQELFTEIK